MGTKIPSAMRIEYHVIHTGEPDGRWEIQYGDQRAGQNGWDRNKAVEEATQMARGNPPSSVIVHAPGGAVERTDSFDEAAPSRID